MSNIFRRHKKQIKYTQVPNNVIRNPKIKNSAFRLLCYLQSNSDSWEVFQDHVQRELGWGDDMLSSAIKNLKQCKYLIVHKKRSNTGKYYYLYEFDWEEIEDSESFPIENDDSNNFTTGGFSTPGESTPGKPPLIQRTTYQKQPTKTAVPSCPKGSSIPSIQEVTAHSDHSETVRFDIDQKEEKETPREEFLKHLAKHGIDLREDTIGYMAFKYTLSELQAALYSYLDAKKRYSKRKEIISNPEGLFRATLLGKSSSKYAGQEEDNFLWAHKFTEENKMNNVQFYDDYIKNTSTGNEISFNINKKDFMRSINSWIS